MKTIITLLLTFILSITMSFSQQMQGIATYKTDRKVDLKIDEENGMNEDIQKQIQAQLKAQFQKEFTLTFNKDESLYKEVPKLGAPQASSNTSIQITVSGGSDLLYKNTAEGIFKSETEIMSKEFLIEDTIEKQDWKLEKETKNIGDYLCFKATLTEMVDEETFDDTTMEYKKEKVERVTTAWYTLQIPVKHGPAMFGGLPGLVLEINDGKQTILCSKIVLNPKEGVSIKIPKKGKKVTQEEFDEIQEKKNKEMLERFQNSGNNRRKGTTTTIRIGG